jgi:PhnB protein
MEKKVKAVPDGMHTVSPVLKIRGCAAAMEFFKKAFGAEELMRTVEGDKVLQASMRIGDSTIFLNDEMPLAGRGCWRWAARWGEVAQPALLWLYVENVDEAFKHAVDAGARPVGPLADMFWGDRFGMVVDPWGNRWGLAQHVKDLAPEEVKKAQEDYHAQMSRQHRT